MDPVAEAARIHESNPVVDGHNNLPWGLRKRGQMDLDGINILEHQPDMHTDIPRLHAGGVGVQFWSVWLPATENEPLRATLE